MRPALPWILSAACALLACSSGALGTDAADAAPGGAPVTPPGEDAWRPADDARPVDPANAPDARRPGPPGPGPDTDADRPPGPDTDADPPPAPDADAAAPPDPPPGPVPDAATPPGPVPDAAPPPAPETAPPPPRVPTGHYASSLSTVGRVDANAATYMYAPAFVFDGALYHYYACVGVQGDFVQHKSAPTLAALAGAPMQTVLSPDPGETHTCDPAVVRGDDGRWYLHYSNTPGGVYTDAGVAVGDRPEGPFRKISQDLLGRYRDLSPGQYGRGQTTVARGHDGAWYMAFTNQIEPLERMSIVVLRSADPTFSVARDEVTRIDPGLLGGWSTQLSYDPRAQRYVFVEPAGGAGFLVTSFDTAWQHIGQETLPLPPGAGVPGEGQALLTDPEGRLLVGTPDAPGALVVAGATEGPDRGFPTWITGPNEFRTFRVFPVGIVDAVAGVPGAVQIAGWSFDPNDRGFPIDTHVYIGQAGVEHREGTNLGATAVDRPDVNATQGTAGPHGFWAEIPTAFRGDVDVCIAAINIGAGDNEWLACRSARVP